jgi:hypothetical protein
MLLGSLAFGFWLLAFGFWLLAFGFLAFYSFALLFSNFIYSFTVFTAENILRVCLSIYCIYDRKMLPN